MKKPYLLILGHTTATEVKKDPIDLIKDELKDPLDAIKALEMHYEIALSRLVERPDLNDNANQRLAIRLTRHFLFNYFFGFLWPKYYVPAHEGVQGAAGKSSRQQKIEGLIQKLARRSKASRQLMVEYFTAALERRVHRKWRDFIRASKLTLHPRRAYERVVTRLLLADDWEKVFRHGVTFGLSGFYLLFTAPPDDEFDAYAPGDEFDALIRYAQQRAYESNWQDVKEAVRVLAGAHLAAEQQRQLLGFVPALLDLKEYPYNPQDEFATIEARGLSPVVKRFFRVLVSWGKVQPIRIDERESLDRRKKEVAEMLILLGHQKGEAFQLLEAIIQEDSKKALGVGLIRWSHLTDAWQSLEPYSKSLLLASATNSQALDTLFRCVQQSGQVTLSGYCLEALRDSSELWGAEATESLLIAISADANSRPLAEQILDNIPGLTGDALDMIAETIQERRDIAVLSALTRLLQRLEKSERRIASVKKLQEVLAAGLITILFDPMVPLQSEWIAFLIGIPNGEPLRRILEKAGTLLEERSPSLQSRSKEVLKAIATEAEKMSEPDSVMLAACWLIDPPNWIWDDLDDLTDRVREAKGFLDRPADRQTAERVSQILDAVISRHSLASKVIAQALRTLHHPDLALPLLEKLMDMAATGHAGRDTYVEVFRSVAALNPLTPEGVRVLCDSLLTSQHPSTRTYTALTPAAVYDSLPLLAHDVVPEAIDLLIDIVWHHHCVVCGQTLSMAAYQRPSFQLALQELSHRYLHSEYQERYDKDLLICALQALTKVSTLSPFQQRIIAHLYRTSWQASVKSRCLLILSRQRPLPEKTLKTLVRILKTGPISAFLLTAAKDAVRHFLFRLFRRGSPSLADVNDTLLCQSVAVYALGEILLEGDNPLVTKHRQRIERALLTLISPWRSLMEPHLIGSDAATKGISQIISPVQNESEPQKQSWRARPSAQGRETLRVLREADALESGEEDKEVTALLEE